MANNATLNVVMSATVVLILAAVVLTFSTGTVNTGDSKFGDWIDNSEIDNPPGSDGDDDDDVQPVDGGGDIPTSTSDAAPVGGKTTTGPTKTAYSTEGSTTRFVGTEPVDNSGPKSKFILATLDNHYGIIAVSYGRGSGWVQVKSRKCDKKACLIESSGESFEQYITGNPFYVGHFASDSESVIEDTNYELNVDGETFDGGNLNTDTIAASYITCIAPEGGSCE
jgi:hypothetical protein